MESFHRLSQTIVFYGFIIVPIIDSVFIVIASRNCRNKRLGAFKGWLSFHIKFGVGKVNSLKILLLPLLSIIKLFGNPQFPILIFYVIHVIAFGFDLVFKCNKQSKQGVAS